MSTSLVSLRRWLSAIALGAAFVTLSARAGDARTAQAEEFTDYANKAHGFSLSLPKSWTVTEGWSNEVMMAKTPASIAVSGGKFSPNIVVHAESSQGAALKDYVDFERKQLGQDDPTYKILAEGLARNGTAYRFQSRLAYDKLDLKQIVFVTGKGDRFYVIIATAPAELWPTFEAKLGRIVESFH